MIDDFNFDDIDQGDDDDEEEELATCVGRNPLVSSRTTGPLPIPRPKPKPKAKAKPKAQPRPKARPKKATKAGRMGRPEPEVPTFFPNQPRTMAETGLSPSYVEELCLKHLFQAGDLKGADIVNRIALPGALIEKVMGRLRKSKYIEIKGTASGGVGRSGMIFSITKEGLSYVEHSMQRDRYIGPAPVTYEHYLKSVEAQTIRGNQLSKDDIAPHFKDLVIEDHVYDAIGPAMNSGQALFFYGPPGNGKTAICQRMTSCFGGTVYIPHAIIVDDFIIKVYDETIHKPITDNQGSLGNDHRWVRCERPMVVVGGELMLDDLDLSYSSEVKYYEAPFQMKANCGMLLIDDFGRQKVSPTDLLNRWIVPLESEVDYLSMHTGKKLKVPFNVFVTFSTNLDPKALVDAAFMRRVPYKLEVTRPDVKLFGRIFQRECKKYDIPWDKSMFWYLVKTHYQPHDRPYNACEPRDLLKQVVNLCAYHGESPAMSEEVLDQVVENYFVQFE